MSPFILYCRHECPFKGLHENCTERIHCFTLAWFLKARLKTCYYFLKYSSSFAFKKKSVLLKKRWSFWKVRVLPCKRCYEKSRYVYTKFVGCHLTNFPFHIKFQIFRSSWLRFICLNRKRKLTSDSYEITDTKWHHNKLIDKI